MKELFSVTVPKGITQAFTSIFLSIYFLNVTHGDVVSVAIYNLLFYFSIPLFMYLIAKKIKKENIITIYRIGILLNFVIFMILLLMQQNIVKVIFPFAIFYGLEEALYWLPYHIIVYNVNQENSYKKFFAYAGVVSKFVLIVTSFLSGYLIQASSFQVVFILIAIVTFIAFLFTFRLQNITFEQEPIEDKKIRTLLKNKNAQRIYQMSFFEGLGPSGGLNTAIQLVIFLQFNSEFTLGYLNAVFAIVAIITSILVNKYLKQKHYTISYVISAITLFLSLVLLIIGGNATVFIIYNIVFNITYQITSILYNISLYETNKDKELAEARLENIFLKEMYLMIGRVTSYVGILVIGSVAFTTFSMQFVVALFTLSIVIEAMYYTNMHRTCIHK